MLSTVSPVMVGADAASPQPTTPLSASTRTSTLSACRISTPAMNTGFFIGKLTAIGSTLLISTARSPQLSLNDLPPPQFRDCLCIEPEFAGQNLLAVLAERRRGA